MSNRDSFNNPTDNSIKEMLSGVKTVAVVGLSDKPQRDSYKVARYLKDKGYRIIPVNPNLSEVLDEKCYPSLSSIDESIDIVNIFRKGEETPAIVEECLSHKPEAIWMQLGVVNDEAAASADKNGIKVIMNRCIKQEHQRLFEE